MNYDSLRLESPPRRMAFSFILAIFFHFCLFFMINFFSLKKSKELKVIESVELIEEIPVTEPKLIKKKRDLFSILKSIISIKKKELKEIPGPPLIEKVKEETLVEKPKKLKELKLEELIKMRDEKILDFAAAIEKTHTKLPDKLLEGEKLVMKERAPKLPKTEVPIKLEEVGLKRADRFVDFKFVKKKEKKVKELKLGPLAKLVEKKKEMIRLLASKELKGIKFTEKKRPKIGKIKEFAYLPKRKEIKELLALEREIKLRSIKRPTKKTQLFKKLVSTKPVVIEKLTETKPKKIKPITPVKTDLEKLLTELKTTKPLEKKLSDIEKAPVKISGPLKKRKIISAYIPIYPQWAKEKEIEASVTLSFTVSPDGMVNDDIFVKRTSGNIKLDQLAISALRKWVFAPIETEENQQGEITFIFELEWR